ncbi:sugar transporter SWEET1 isoform X2 [Erythrolamprus reginae]|uniref:sugar transporter SWEET1 isoform X2 n=1 Tax=Erythrolamprus reginae TaxID=121349 RepID=UPI00396C8A8D
MVLLFGYAYFSLMVPDPVTRLAQLGLFCSVFTITMYLSPLADLVPESRFSLALLLLILLGWCVRKCFLVGETAELTAT